MAPDCGPHSAPILQQHHNVQRGPPTPHMGAGRVDSTQGPFLEPPCQNPAAAKQFFTGRAQEENHCIIWDFQVFEDFSSVH